MTTAKDNYLRHCFVAKRIGGEYVVEFDMFRIFKEFEAVMSWCKETYGPDGRNSKYRWRFGWCKSLDNDNLFYFKNYQDATWFILKWK